MIFLVGGAIVSAVRYRRTRETYPRFIGNVYIAIGAILPGIGGAFTRFGHTEVLYVTELIGLLCIFAGYRLNVTGRGTRETGKGEGLAGHGRREAADEEKAETLGISHYQGEHPECLSPRLLHSGPLTANVRPRLS